MIDPWDLDPEWWMSHVFDLEGSTQGDVLDLVGIPCQFDRWCMSASQDDQPLPDEIDPEAFRRFVDAGPVIAQPKQVRFSPMVDVHYFDEGDASNGGSRDDGTLEDLEWIYDRTAPQHRTQTKHWWTDYVGGMDIFHDPVQVGRNVCDFKQFWEECVESCFPFEWLHEGTEVAQRIRCTRNCTPPDLIDVEGEANGSLSLLQKAMHRVVFANGGQTDSIPQVVMVHGNGSICLHESSTLSHFQILSKAVQSNRLSFASPQAWVHMCNVSCGSDVVPVWAHCDAERAFGHSVIFAELLASNASGELIGHTVISRVTPSTVDWHSLASDIQHIFPGWVLTIDKLVCGDITRKVGQQAFLDHEAFCQIWCVADAQPTSCEEAFEDPSGHDGISYTLLTFLSLQEDRIDFLVEGQHSLEETIHDFAGGCGWSFLQHPQQMSEQKVVVIDWDRVIRDQSLLQVALLGAVHENQPVMWYPVKIENGLCYPDTSWHEKGGVFRNGVWLDCWTTGILAVHGDCILWVAPSSSTGDRVAPGDAPCQFDRWCADPCNYTVPFGEDCVTRFCKWMDKTVPVRSKKPLVASSHDFAPRAVPPPKVSISLEASLCCQPSNEEPLGAIVRVHDECWRTLQQDDNILLAPLPDGLRVHPATAQALLKCHPCKVVARTTIYIDGSADDLAAGWAVVVVHEGTDGEVEFAGCLCGTVCVNEAHADWIGATSATNIDAELQAMVVAQLLALQTVPGRAVVIRPDLKFSHQLACLSVGARNDDALPAMVAALGSVTSSEVSINEVRGHTGDPWNELADKLAKFAPTLQSTHGRFPLKAVRQLACNKLTREWIWWGNAPSHYKHAYPLEPTPGEWCITPCSDSITTPVADAVCLGEQILQIKCTVATLNVCSARDSEGRPQVTKGARAARLDQQLHHANVAIAGLQETRMPRSESHTALPRVCFRLSSVWKVHPLWH